MQVLPMPDEMSIGHIGRICYITANRVSINLNSDHYLFRRALGENGSKKSFMEQLAKHTGMDPTAYAAQHSMMPVMRPSCRNDSHRLHGDPRNINVNRIYGLDWPKKYAYVCPHCVEEDQVKTGYSWFKRIHHLEGIDWCVKHKTPLFKIKAQNPWLRVPGWWLGTNDLEPESTSYGDDDSGFLDRYADISLAFLNKTKAYLVFDLAMMLGLRFKLQRERMGGSAAGVMLSDTVKAAVPRSWGQKHWPALMAKAPGEFLQGLDSLITNIESLIPCLVYSASMAALFDTSAEVQELLVDLDQQRIHQSITNWVSQAHQSEGISSCLDCAV